MIKDIKCNLIEEPILDNLKKHMNSSEETLLSLNMRWEILI